MYPIVVVSGLRRVGKSSLVRVFLNEQGDPFLSIDARRLYEMSSGNISSLHFTKLIAEEVNKLSKLEKFVDFLKKIRGVTVFGNAIEIEVKKFDLSDMFEKSNSFAQHNADRFVVFIDEARYLRFYGSR